CDTHKKQHITAKNSHGWMRLIRMRSSISNKPIAEAITTAANAAEGKCCSRFGATNKSRATLKAPTNPVNWLPNSGLNIQRHRFGRQSLLSWVSLGTPTETQKIGDCCARKP